MSNPLLQNSELPRFSAIKPEHVEPAIDQVLATIRSSLQELLQQVANQPDWHSLVKPLTKGKNTIVVLGVPK